MADYSAIEARVSLPTRGGWIETIADLLDLLKHKGPSPHGEGGLKHGIESIAEAALQSLPTRGGWIETWPA